MQSNLPPTLNLTDPKAVIVEIFDNDNWVKEEFTKQFSTELMRFAEILAESFKWYPKIQALVKNEDEQALYVAAFVHGIFDDLITSTKLLVTGKMIPSGNLMRQALEGISVAILCSSRSLLLIPKNGKNRQSTVSIKYWERVKEIDKRVESHKAISHLELNLTHLHVNKDAIDALKSGIKIYHQFSHPSISSLVARVRETDTEITQYIGGVFNEIMIPKYKFEIEQRTNLCRILPNLIELVITHLNSKH
jgi:hypothetical protein